MQKFLRDETMTVASVRLDIRCFNDRIIVNTANGVSSSDAIGMSSILGASIAIARCLNVAGVVKLSSFILVGLLILR